MSAPASGPAASGRLRWQRRATRALPASVTKTLGLRSVYVLPTRAGLALAATLVLLLVASINFQLSLGYALTFLLAGAAGASVFWAFRTLAGLRLSTSGLAPVFAGATLPFTVNLDNRSPRRRYAVGVALRDADERAWIWTDVEPQASAPATLGVPAERRGWQRLPALVVETRFPLGVFRAWSPWQPAAAVLVYPAPEASPPPLPARGAREDAGAAQRTAPGSEYTGVRAYRAGDPLKRIVWKKVLPGGGLVSRETATSAGGELWLSLEATGLAQTEAQLARLAAWVLLAQAAGLRYGLVLGAERIAPAQDEAHRLACLRALALYRMPPSPAQPAPEDA